MAETSPLAIVKDTARRLCGFIGAVVASWPALAVSSLCMIAFGAQFMVAPERLPPFGSLSPAQLGLPLALPDLGDVGEQAGAAARSAQPHALDAVARVQAEHPTWVRWLNLGGLIVSFAMLVITMGLQTLQFQAQARLEDGATGS